jgi:hypothetical protein
MNVEADIIISISASLKGRAGIIIVQVYHDENKLHLMSDVTNMLSLIFIVLAH